MVIVLVITFIVCACLSRSTAVWNSAPSLVNVTCLGLLAMLAGKSWNVWNGGRWCSYLAARSKKETRRVGTACLSRSLLLLPLSPPRFCLSACFELLFLAPIGQRRLEVNEIKKKKRKTSAFHYIHETQCSVSEDGRGLEMWFSFLFSAEGLLCFIKLRLMFVQCHWNCSWGKD